jgi:hypothetical protein
MPNGDSSWYINSYDGKENYEVFFIKEFMPAVEKTKGNCLLHIALTEKRVPHEFRLGMEHIAGRIGEQG